MDKDEKAEYQRLIWKIVAFSAVWTTIVIYAVISDNQLLLNILIIASLLYGGFNIITTARNLLKVRSKLQTIRYLAAQLLLLLFSVAMIISRMVGPIDLPDWTKYIFAVLVVLGAAVLLWGVTGISQITSAGQNEQTKH